MDCDPQCNVTELFFASSKIVDDPDRELPGTSVYEALRLGFSGSVGKFDLAQVDLVQSEIYENLYLLKGDLELSRAETLFARAWNRAITEDIREKSIYSVLYRLLCSLGLEGSFDYILCDVAPSTGAITRMAVLACDGFFLPLVPDRFSYHAVSVLGKSLKDWIRKHEEISKTFEPFKLESFPGRPIFLGAVIQKFKVLRATPAKRSYSIWQERIEEIVDSSFLSEGWIPTSPKLDGKNSVVATIDDVGPLAPISLAFGRAIFDVEKENIAEISKGEADYADLVWQNWEDRMESYREEIKKIAEALP